MERKRRKLLVEDGLRGLIEDALEDMIRKSKRKAKLEFRTKKELDEDDRLEDATDAITNGFHVKKSPVFAHTVSAI